MKIFVSHTQESAREARDFKSHICGCSEAAEVFLSSDWDSIRSGDVVLEAVERSMRECDYFIALIVRVGDAHKLWVNYEIGFARGRGLLPKIIVFFGADKNITQPLNHFRWLPVGDTNRWELEFGQMGLDVAKRKKEFQDLFNSTVHR